MKYQWIFKVGSSSYWSFDDVTYASQPYTAKILPQSFTGVKLRWSLAGSLIPSNDCSFEVSDPTGAGGSYDGQDVLIRLLEDGVLKRSWLMKVKRTIAYHRKIKFECVDILQEKLKGDYPNKPSPKDLYPSDATVPDDNYCIPVVFGNGYVPLRPVWTGSEHHYLIGPSGVTYTITECSSPHDWHSSNTWAFPTPYTMDQDTLGSYIGVQPEIHDLHGDGSEYADGVWKPSDTYLDMPTKFTRSDTSLLDTPAEWLEYILEDMGVASGDISSGTWSTNSVTFGGGFWEKESRESVISSLLAQCDSYLTLGDDIELRPFSATSVETFTDLLSGSFRPSIVTRSVSDGGTVKWQHANKPQDILNGQAQVGVYGAQSSVSNPSSDEFRARFISDSQDAQRAAILYFQKKYDQISRVSWAVAGPSITNLDTLSPGMVVTVNHANYGGSRSLIITSMRIGRDLRIEFEGVELNHLEDWGDLTPGAVSIDTDTATNVQTPLVATAPLIGIKKNTVSFSTASNGYAYIHGFDNSGEAADIKGKINWDGGYLYIPQTENSSTWTINTSQEADGYIVLDTALAGKFTVSAAGHSVVFAYLDGDTWKYDNGSAWTTWTPASTDMVIGTISRGATSITTAAVWGYAQELSFFSSGGDVTADNPQPSDWITDSADIVFANDSITRLTGLYLDNLADGTYGKVLSTDISNGHIILSSVDGDLSDLDGNLDDIANGTTYGKVLSTNISSGRIILGQCTGDLDDIANGTYGKVLLTDIDAGHIKIASCTGDLDDISNGSTYGKVSLTNISAGKIILSGCTGDLDDIDDGGSYKKIGASYVSSGKHKFTSLYDDGGIFTISSSKLRISTSEGIEVTNSGDIYFSNGVSDAGTLQAYSSGIEVKGDSELYLTADGGTITTNEIYVFGKMVPRIPSGSSGYIGESSRVWERAYTNWCITEDDWWTGSDQDRWEVWESASSRVLRVVSGGDLSIEGDLYENQSLSIDTKIHDKWELFNSLVDAYEHHDPTLLHDQFRHKEYEEDEFGPTGEYDYKVKRKDFVQIAIECMADIKADIDQLKAA